MEFIPNLNYTYQTKFIDSLSRESHINSILSGLQKKGYWYLSIKEKKYSNNTLIIKVILNKPIYWEKLEQGNLDDIFLEKLSLHKFTHTIFDFEVWEKFSKKILKNAENKGYPFAKIQLDSIQNNNDSISARINFQKGFYVTWDTLSIRGNLKLKRFFLEKYLQIRKDEPYSQLQLEKAEKLLKNLGFIKIVKPTQVFFETQRAKPVFFVNQTRSNEIDGILGLMPNELSRNSLLLTGQAQIRLRNLFNSAKSLEAEFQQLKPNHQLLQAIYKHPILFGSKLNLEFNFKLLREDTNFVNINRHLRFTYPVNLYTNFKLFGGIQSSQTGFTPNSSISKLPINQENKYTFYGLGYEYNQVDDIFLPKNGIQVQLDLQTGNKSIERLPFLSDSLYQNIQLKSLQTSILLKQNYYKMIRQKSGLYIKLEGGILVNRNLLQNELFRLGGLSSIRGFNQNFFFASSYALSTIEYRYFWQDDAYFSFFYDQAVLEAKILDTKTKDTPLGIGTGISFQTKGGIFNLSYALGYAQNQNLSITKSKIHFGFISRF
ncbi:MAG: hypothetical protein MUC49_03700 [Raineya sp.]|jgi:outer membrane protein assembly factor BamA|nr:hypothetical protein [Raineya sp.]